MLLNFKFSNFKSYPESTDTVLEFEASRASEKNDTLLTYSGKKILPVIAVYGPNGGGKSNLLAALDKCLDYIKYSANMSKDKKTKNEYFLFSNSKKIKFEISFKATNNCYKFEFCLDNNKVLYESLDILKKTSIEKLYTRKNNIYEFQSKKVSSLEKYSADVGDDVLFISSIIKTNNKYIAEIKEWVLNVEYMDYGQTFFELYNQINNKLMSETLEEDKEIYLRMLNNADIKIDSLEFEEVTSKDSNGDDEVSIQPYFVYDDIRMPLQKESAGTQKLFSLIPHLFLSIKNGNLLIVDEIDAKLHPRLVESIIQMFTDKEVNKNGAQLLFTSHNICYLQNDLLRRDEIYFVTKNGKRESIIEKLYDIRDENGNRFRNDSDYMKNYMKNIFGYIPDISKLYKDLD